MTQSVLYCSRSITPGSEVPTLRLSAPYQLLISEARVDTFSQPSIPPTLAVAGVILFKGGLVIDRYMEMPTAKVSFRRVLYSFSAILALMVLLTQGFGEALMRLTTIY